MNDFASLRDELVGLDDFDPSEPRDEGGKWTAGAGHVALFKAFEDAPTNEGIEAAESNWRGGVANLGDPEAAILVQQMPGYFDYRSHLEEAAREHLGDEFDVWRSMPRSQLEAWKNGEDIGPVGTTLNPDLAKKWQNLAANKSDRAVVKIKAAPGAIVMRGHEGESELVIDPNSLDASTVEEVDHRLEPDNPPAVQGSDHPQTKTPQFKAFFKRSKIVDGQGRPLRMYHGTHADFSKFDLSKSRSGAGMWLTSDPNYASDRYAGGSGDYSGPEGGSVMPMFVSMQNPRVFDLPPNATHGHLARYSEPRTDEQLKAAGYDGVLYRIGGAGGHMIAFAFDPKQAKSATGNKGTFDPASEVITDSFNPNEPRDESGKWAGGGGARFQSEVHKDASPQQLKALAHGNKAGIARFVIYKDGTINAGDAHKFTHIDIAPADGAWAVRGYIRHNGGDDFSYTTQEPFGGPLQQPDHPSLRRLEKAGIVKGNPLSAADAFDPDEPRDEGGKWTSGGGSLYHVTFTKNAKSIAKKGVQPGHKPVWEKAAGGKYRSPHVFAFEHKDDAVRWAARTDWEFHQGHGTGKVSIVHIRSKKGDEWIVDARDPLSQAGSKGQWLKRAAGIDPKDVEKIEPLTQPMIRDLVKRQSAADDFNPNEPRDAGGKWTAGGGAAPKVHTAKTAEWKDISFDMPFGDGKTIPWQQRVVVNPARSQVEHLLEGAPFGSIQMARDQNNDWVAWDAPDTMNDKGVLKALEKIGHQIATPLQIAGPKATEKAAAHSMKLDDVPHQFFALEESEDEKVAQEKARAAEQARIAAYEAEKKRKADAKAAAQAVITGTKPFKAWFKKSKVVDREGRPLRAYHGTTLDFTEFHTAIKKPGARKPGSAYSGELGAWFAAPSLHQGNYDEGGAESVASQFAGENIDDYDEGASVVPVYLSIQNPMEFEDFESLLEERDEEFGGNAHKMRKALIKDGYDGVVVRNSMTDGNVDRDDWVAFYPQQIKSATGNKGTFDPTSGVITDSMFAADFDPSEPRDEGGKWTAGSPAFKRWFGKSKVVDKSGKPLRMYHGTPSVFAAFGAHKEGFQRHWVSSDPETASLYAVGQNGANVMPLYASIQHPLVYDARGDKYGPAMNAWANTNDDDLEERGYDGVLFLHDDDHKVAYVFDPAKLKSAIGSGFNPKSAVVTDSQARADWDESQHPRGQPENAGEFAKAPGGGNLQATGKSSRGIEFISPNIEEGTKIRQARRGFKGSRHKFIVNVAKEVDKAMGIEAYQRPVIGMWSDGAENSTMSVMDSVTWDDMVASAAMKGWLAKQKQVLVFKEGETDPAHGEEAGLASFNAKGKPEEISQYLAEHGLQYHTLEPIFGNDVSAAKAFTVYVYGNDKDTAKAVMDAGEHYGSDVTIRKGRGAFLGTEKQDGSPDEQRADARAVFDRLLAQSGSKAGRAVWQGLRDRYGKQADQVVHDQTETPQFKHWFGDSKLVDEDGQPLVLYHGTLGDFESFDKSRANVESNWGAGIYFTNDPDDLSHNYAGRGPDITGRIENMAEQIESEDDFEGDHDEAKRRAERLMDVQHEGAAIPVFVKMERPFKVGGRDETHLDFSLPFDEATETEGQPSGKAHELIEAIREVGHASDLYDNEDIDKFADELQMHALENDGIQASKLESLASQSDALAYISNAEGKTMSSEILRQALQKIGFDGIIDTRVSQKFPGMKGMKPSTTHYIVFDPHQAKSAIGNRGTFDPKSTKVSDSAYAHDAYNPNEPRIPKGQPGGGQWTSGGGAGMGFLPSKPDDGDPEGTQAWKNGTTGGKLTLEPSGKWWFTGGNGNTLEGMGSDEESLNTFINAHKAELQPPGAPLIEDLAKMKWEKDNIHGYWHEFKNGKETVEVDETTGAWKWRHTNGSEHEGTGRTSMLYLLASLHDEADPLLAEAQEAELKAKPFNPNTVGNSAGLGFKLALDNPPGETYWVNDELGTQIGIKDNGAWRYSSDNGQKTIASGGTRDALKKYLTEQKDKIAPPGSSVIDSLNALDFIGDDNTQWQNFQTGDDKVGINTKTALWVYVDPVTGEAIKGTGDKALLEQLAQSARFAGKAQDRLDRLYPEPQPTVEWVPNPASYKVGGDKWNQDTAIRLEHEFMAVAPELDSMANKLWKDPTPPPMSEAEKTYVEAQAEEKQAAASWDELSDEAKESTENAWVKHNLSDFINSEQENYAESGQALEDAKKELAADKDMGWVADAVSEFMDSYTEKGIAVPYDSVAIFKAITPKKFESKYGDGKGDVEIEFNDAELQHPEGLPYDPEKQGVLPGVEKPDPSSMLTPQMRDDLLGILQEKFEHDAEHNADNAEAPDYLKDSAEEQAHEYWSQLDDEQAYKAAQDYLTEEEMGGAPPPPPDKAVYEGSFSELDHPPSHFDPLNRGSGANYQRTQQISKALSIARGVDLLTKRGIVNPGNTLNFHQERMTNELADVVSGSSFVNDMANMLKVQDWEHTDAMEGYRAHRFLWLGRALAKPALKINKALGVNADSSELAARMSAAIRPSWSKADQKLYVDWAKDFNGIGIKGLTDGESNWIEEHKSDIQGQMRDVFEEVARKKREGGDPENIRANVERIDDDVWQAWVGSSTSFGGKIIQIASADELGGHARIPGRPDFMLFYKKPPEATLMDGYRKQFVDEKTGEIKVATLARDIEAGLAAAQRALFGREKGSMSLTDLLEDQAANNWDLIRLAPALAKKAVVRLHSEENPDNLVVEYKDLDGLNDAQKQFVRGAWQEINTFVTARAKAMADRETNNRASMAEGDAKARSMGVDPDAPVDPNSLIETMKMNNYGIADAFTSVLDNDPAWKKYQTDNRKIGSSQFTPSTYDIVQILARRSDDKHIKFKVVDGKAQAELNLGDDLMPDHPVAREIVERLRPTIEANLNGALAAQEVAIRNNRRAEAINKFMNISSHGWETKEQLIAEANRKYSNIGGYEGLKALMRAKWETSQWLLAKAGVHELSLYRGIEDDDVNLPTITKVTDSKGFVKLPKYSTKRNGAASTSTDAKVANTWKGDSNRVVLRLHVPRTAVISLPSYGKNVHSEHEVVVTGTAWKDWDAYKKTAPLFAEVPIEHHAAPPVDPSIKEAA